MKAFRAAAVAASPRPSGRLARIFAAAAATAATAMA
jgi:hypothetical protein